MYDSTCKLTITFLIIGTILFLVHILDIRAYFETLTNRPHPTYPSYAEYPKPQVVCYSVRIGTYNAEPPYRMNKEIYVTGLPTGCALNATVNVVPQR
jgi:hypothetical protein